MPDSEKLLTQSSLGKVEEYVKIKPYDENITSLTEYLKSKWRFLFNAQEKGHLLKVIRQAPPTADEPDGLLTIIDENAVNEQGEITMEPIRIQKKYIPIIIESYMTQEGVKTEEASNWQALKAKSGKALGAVKRKAARRPRH